MIKLFKIKSFAYTPFVNKQDLEYLKNNGIIITNDISEADVLISQNLKHLKKYFWRYFKNKNYLIWTLEPRFDLSFSASKSILLGFHKCHFMNIYTRDVYTSINPFYKRVKNELNPISANFELGKDRKIVALMSYYLGSNTPAIMLNKKNIDLIALRTELALAGHQRGIVDIYGKGWPHDVSIENSRDGGWHERKEEILKKYNFNLCFENTIAHNYVTEKIWDSIGCYCLPIYYGKGTNIYSIFPEDSFIDYSNFENPEQLFNYIEKMQDDEFVNRLNKCIEVYMYLKNQDEDFHWKKKKVSLDNIIMKCRTITNKN